MLGVKQIMVRRFEPTGVFKLIAKHHATHMSLVPTMANALLNAPDLGQYDLSSMRQIMIGGAAASPDLIERVEKVFDCEAFGGYGLTETSPVLTSARRKRNVSDEGTERYRRHAMAGWPVPGVCVRVVDANMS